MVRKSFRLPTGDLMEYEFMTPVPRSDGSPVPFLVSISGRDQLHVNGFGQRLLSQHWVVVSALRPKSAPLLFQGTGRQGDGTWHVYQLCQHLLREYSVSGGRFVLAGVSNGGNSVLRFATLWPELCCGLVVVTGSLHGLADLQEACKRLRGIPVDMYVGSKDECGFYKPMVSTQDQLRAVDHTPLARLTVFKDAGHVCSPLIDDYMIHGKITMMLMHAGAVGNVAKLSVAKNARQPSEKVVAMLLDFCQGLNLQFSQESDGLTVTNAQRLKTATPQATPAVVVRRQSSCRQPHDFKKDEAVEVWSNSGECWGNGEIVDIMDDTGDIKVIFEDERGRMSKMIPVSYVHKFLRKKKEPAARGFMVGDSVAIWSNAQKTWFKDGTVTDTSAEDGIKVVFRGGKCSKVVPRKYMAKYLRNRSVLPTPLD